MMFFMVEQENRTGIVSNVLGLFAVAAGGGVFNVRNLQKEEVNNHEKR